MSKVIVEPDGSHFEQLDLFPMIPYLSGKDNTEADDDDLCPGCAEYWWDCDC